MLDQGIPELVFDDALAQPVFPQPVVKYAVLVPIPHEFPTFIQPEWDPDGNHPQVFYGNYYLVLDAQGRGRYGSAAIQWENMHTTLPIETMVAGIPAIAFVKTEVPIGYRVTARCVIVTLIPHGEGEVRESRKIIEPGTLVLRQPGGEVQFVNPKNEAVIYFGNEEAAALGLPGMDQAQFAAWAVAQAMAALHAAIGS